MEPTPGGPCRWTWVRPMLRGFAGRARQVRRARSLSMSLGLDDRPDPGEETVRGSHAAGDLPRRSGASERRPPDRRTWQPWAPVRPLPVPRRAATGGSGERLRSNSASSRSPSGTSRVSAARRTGSGVERGRPLSSRASRTALPTTRWSGAVVDPGGEARWSQMSVACCVPGGGGLLRSAVSQDASRSTRRTGPPTPGPLQWQGHRRIGVAMRLSGCPLGVEVRGATSAHMPSSRRASPRSVAKRIWVLLLRHDHAGAAVGVVELDEAELGGGPTPGGPRRGGRRGEGGRHHERHRVYVPGRVPTWRPGCAPRPRRSRAGRRPGRGRCGICDPLTLPDPAGLRFNQSERSAGPLQVASDRVGEAEQVVRQRGRLGVLQVGVSRA